MPFDWGWFGFVYNKNILKNPPKSFQDLSNMSDDVKIVIQDPRTSTPGLGLLLWIKSVYDDKAIDYWRELQPKILTVTKGWSEAYALFLDGEADMVLSYTTHLLIISLLKKMKIMVLLFLQKETIYKSRWREC